jgi:hypothetical protein
VIDTTFLDRHDTRILLRLRIHVILFTMSSPCRGDVLTMSNLQKHTVYSHETPRTKVIRYFNQFEDPRFLSHRDPSPIPSSLPHHHQDPWEVAKAFFSGSPPEKKLDFNLAYERDVLKSNYSGSKEDYPARGSSSCSGGFPARVSIRGQ